MSPADSTELYLARVAPWDWHDEGTVDILDEQGHVTATLDDWQTLVFHEADANTTVGELIAMLKRRPPVDAKGIPVDPTGDVLTALHALTADLRAVELREDKSELDSDHNLPVSQRHLLDDEDDDA